MSVQFGKCNLDGKPVDPEQFNEARCLLAKYGPDAEGFICKENFGVLYRAFHTTSESRREKQPLMSRSGTIIAWDGRLDNRKELIERLSCGISFHSTDLEIAVAGYGRWGVGTFRELVGDWAFSAWDPNDQAVILAKDFAGTRHLYYTVEKDEVTWCSILDPLVQCPRRSLKLEEEYIAGWTTFFPAPHLTPFVGIHAVPPSSFVRLGRGTQTIRKYWDFDPAKRIRYRADSEYEEHFRIVFWDSVRRRLRSDSPILAELSGGMDSSSIVCVADDIARHEPSTYQAPETVSYYDDSEPNWDERSYFRIVEAKRGKTGCHIDVGTPSPLFFQPEGSFASTPRPVCRSDAANQQFTTRFRRIGSRVLLSGIAGDEVTGGVPTPTPELQDLLATAQFSRLANRLKTWAINKKQPWLRLLRDAAASFFPPSVTRAPEIRRPVPWLEVRFANRNRLALLGYPSRAKVFGPLPSFQENLAALEALRRQMGCDVPNAEPLYEARYPYLDRGLLEFLFAIPREQLVRPGQRRSLMRRALAGAVPDEVLNRRRKGFVSHTPTSALVTQCAILTSANQQMLTTILGITDSAELTGAFKRVRDGQENRIVPLLRIIEVEVWLRQLVACGALKIATRPTGQEQFARERRVQRDSVSA